LNNVLCNYAVTYTTKVLIPIKLVLKRVQETLPFTGVGLGGGYAVWEKQKRLVSSQGELTYLKPLL